MENKNIITFCGRKPSQKTTLRIIMLTHVRKSSIVFQMPLSKCVLIALINYFRSDTFKKKIIVTAREVVLIHPFSLTDASKQKINMKTQNTMALSCHSKLTSTQKESPILLLFGSWSTVFISMFGLSQRFSDNSSLIILVNIQRLHENGKYN